MTNSHIEYAIKKAGNQTALAKRLNCKQQTVSRMRLQGYAHTPALAVGLAKFTRLPVHCCVAPEWRALLRKNRQ